MPRPNRVIGHLSPWVEYTDELEAELEKYVLKESGWVAYDIRVQSELQSKDQELAELRDLVKKSQDEVVSFVPMLEELDALRKATRAEVDRQRHQCGILRQELPPTTTELASLLQGEGNDSAM